MLIPIPGLSSTTRTHLTGLIVVALACLVFCGCAVSSLNHMATTNWVDRHIVPDNKVVQWVMTPVWIPICCVTLAVDNFIIAPVVSLPSAYLDTIDFWKKEAGGYYTEMGILPFRILLTPIIFFGDWLGRTLYAVEPREDAALGWPQWGHQWVRDEKGCLLGPPGMYDPVTKEPKQVEE